MSRATTSDQLCPLCRKNPLRRSAKAVTCDVCKFTVPVKVMDWIINLERQVTSLNRRVQQQRDSLTRADKQVKMLKSRAKESRIGKSKRLTRIMTLAEAMARLLMKRRKQLGIPDSAFTERAKHVGRS